MITYSVLLMVYGVAVAIIFLYALVNLYHVLRYGRVDVATYFMTGIFIAGFAMIMVVSLTYIRTIDWSKPIDLFGPFKTEINNPF